MRNEKRQEKRMQTELTRLLGIQAPIIQGGMAWVANANLAANVSKAGGIGFIGAANAPGEWVRSEIRKAREITDKPVGVNIMLLSEHIDEVAQVVAAGSAVSPQVCDTSVIVKLTRVMMLVPYLFLLGFYLSKKSHTKRTKVPMPWFAILFVVMCGFNSLNILPAVVKSGIIEFDVFLLTVAMFGLGVETNFEKI